MAETQALEEIAASVVTGESLAMLPAASLRDPEPKPASLLPKLLDFIKLAGAAYAVGFAVIMVHTARLGGPVVEAFEFQNIVAGLPVWAVILLALYLWPRAVEPFLLARRGSLLTNDRALIRIVSALVIYVPVMYASVQAIVQLLGHTSVSERMIVFSGVCFSDSLIILLVWYRNQSNRTLLDISFLLTTYSGLCFFVVCYAVLLYPRVPQSVGGGHPVKVRLLLKDQQLRSLTGGEDSTLMSSPVDLFYRTGSFLLVSKGAGQTLIQIPTGEVGAIIYLDSSAR